MRLLLSATVTLLLGACAHGFYLPGAAPHDYVLGDQVNVFVNALTPMLLGKDDAKLVSICSCGIERLMSACRNRNP
jgi:transmembrane 9 superfamily protein 2/4